MTSEQAAAYVNSQAVSALIHAMGMMAENKRREHLGLAQAYGEDAFVNLEVQYMIGDNNVMKVFNEWVNQ